MKHSHDDLELPDNEESMTPNEIIKAMDEFAALQKNASPGPWCWATYSKKRFGLGRAGGPAFFLLQCVHDDTESEAAQMDAMMVTGGRNFPAAEAAALIREMREMLRKIQFVAINNKAVCRVCSKEKCATDCKLVQMLKD